MADTKITALTANTAPILTDIMPMVDDPGGSAATQKITIQNLRRQLFPYGVCGGRLTLTTATPVTTADVTAATTLYFTPYSAAFGCGQIGLYDGSAGWDVLNFTELSLNIGAYTASKPYDIWIYNNSGTAAMDSTVWTDATNRATALAKQDGVYVKTGATTRRYVGTIYINASGGQTDDALLTRYVWNYYNRVPRPMVVKDTTNTWTYNAATWQAANASTANRVQYVKGVSETPITAQVICGIFLGAPNVEGSVGIGIDSTSVNSATTFSVFGAGNATYVLRSAAHATYKGYPGVGYHYVQWLEYARVGTIQYEGDLGTSALQSGMVAEVLG